jgi:hypothetical protein
VDVSILDGREAIMEHARLLEQFAERCGQFGALHWLGYFLGGRGGYWKRPCIVLCLRPGADRNSLKLDDLRGAALFYELSALGIRTGAFTTDDWEGLRTVVAEPALRHQIAALASQTLLRQGAHVVLTTYCAMAFDEARVSPLLHGPGVFWAEHDRAVTKRRLVLGRTYEETLAKFGKRTRTHLRYYRKRLTARIDCEFVADAHNALKEEDILSLNAASRNPLTVFECKRRYRATRDLPGGFLIALRGLNGQLLSVIGGWRQGTTTVMHHQMNASGYEKDSIGTAMRSYFLESEIERGTSNLIFYHGTNDTMSHAFEPEITRDLIVRRKSVYARALRRLARVLASPRYYAETHFLGGSTTFFASVLTSDQLEWNSVPAAGELYPG